MLYWLKSWLRRPETMTLVISPKIEAFYDQAGPFYNQQVQLLESQHSISRYRWRYDLKQRQLLFTHGRQELPELQAQAEIIGSYFKPTQHWEWAWNTVNVPKKNKRLVRQLKHFGRWHKQPRLFTGHIDLAQNLNNKQRLEYTNQCAATALWYSQLKNNKGFSVYRGESDEQIVYFLIYSLNR